MVESISELAKCTDIEMLKAQKKFYHDEMIKRAKKNPLYAAILLKMKDDDFLAFMALWLAKTTITMRIKELEGKTDESF